MTNDSKLNKMDQSDRKVDYAHPSKKLIQDTIKASNISPMFIGTQPKPPDPVEAPKADPLKSRNNQPHLANLLKISMSKNQGNK